MKIFVAEVLLQVTTDENIEVILSKTNHNHNACPVEVEVIKTLSSMKNNFCIEQRKV